MMADYGGMWRIMADFVADYVADYGGLWRILSRYKLVNALYIDHSQMIFSFAEDRCRRFPAEWR